MLIFSLNRLLFHLAIFSRLSPPIFFTLYHKIYIDTIYIVVFTNLLISCFLDAIYKYKFFESSTRYEPPAPYRVFITNLRVGCGHSISFCLHFASSCMYEQGLSCSFCYAGNAFGTYSTATPFRVSSR